MTARRSPHRSLPPRGLVATLALAAVVAAAGVGTGPVAANSAIGSFDVVGPYAAAERLTPPAVTRSVFVLGDSLMVGVVDSRYVTGPSLLDVLLADGVAADASVRVARTIPQATAEFPAIAARMTSADTIVVGLGTNDVYNSGRTDVTAWRASIDSLLAGLDSLGSTARIVWVDVSFQRVEQRATAFNRLLETYRLPTRFEICPWSTAVAAHPEWLGSDGLHLRPDGYAARRNLILSCIGPR